MGYCWLLKHSECGIHTYWQPGAFPELLLISRYHKNRMVFPFRNRIEAVGPMLKKFTCSIFFEWILIPEPPDLRPFGCPRMPSGFAF